MRLFTKMVGEDEEICGINGTPTVQIGRDSFEVPHRVSGCKFFIYESYKNMPPLKCPSFRFESAKTEDASCTWDAKRGACVGLADVKRITRLDERDRGQVASTTNPV
jgi:hypothetical protein